MKPIHLLGALALVFALSSCSRDHDCTCTTTDSSGQVDTSTNTFTVTGHPRRAEDDCDDNESTEGTFTTKCSLD